MALIVKTRTFENTGITTRGLVPVLRVDGRADLVLSLTEAALLAGMLELSDRLDQARELQMNVRKLRNDLAEQARKTEIEAMTLKDPKDPS